MSMSYMLLNEKFSPITDMTYVFGGTLSLTRSISH